MYIHYTYIVRTLYVHFHIVIIIIIIILELFRDV